VLDKVFARHNYKNIFLQKANFTSRVRYNDITRGGGDSYILRFVKAHNCMELRFAYFSLKTLDLDQGYQISE
jgi:hypothetical protein